MVAAGIGLSVIGALWEVGLFVLTVILLWASGLVRAR
jgi:hypothetical protein